MNEPTVYVDGPATEELLSEGTFIVLYNASSIPPHIMLIVNGYYYSISVRGNEIKESVTKLIRRINQNNIHALFLKIDLVASDPSSFFNKYTGPEEGKTTCLYPVKDYLQDQSGIDLSACKFVYEVYQTLVENDKISSCFHFHLDPFIVDSVFRFKKYTLSEIDKCIWLNRLTGYAERN